MSLKDRTERNPKKSICLVFEVHQPFRLRREFFWQKLMFRSGLKLDQLFDQYFCVDLTKQIFERIAAKCYRPANQLMLKLMDEHPEFKLGFSLSGTFLEQAKRFDPDLLEDFRQLASTHRVEFLGQTYYHSLVSLYEHEAEFIYQVKLHSQTIKDEIGVTPSFFENTELLYNNRIARLVESLGYSGIFAEGLERILKGRSPNQVYLPAGCTRLRLLLRNYILTDDIGFRFSLKDWTEYPLTASKYAAWLNATPGQCINIFLDYETLGEHHPKHTGIFEFMEDLPRQILEFDELEFCTPSEVIRKHPPMGIIDVGDFETISWANEAKDTSFLLGNTMQWACYEYLKWLEPYVKEAAHPELLRIWRCLGTSDHLYYMYTGGGAPGEVHSYFSYFQRPQDAFITLFSILHDLDSRLSQMLGRADRALMLPDGSQIWSLEGLRRYLTDPRNWEQFKPQLESGELERWISQNLGHPQIADRIKQLKTENLAQDELRKRICQLISNALSSIKLDQ